jgi:hypothetical protein
MERFLHNNYLTVQVIRRHIPQKILSPVSFVFPRF